MERPANNLIPKRSYNSLRQLLLVMGLAVLCFVETTAQQKQLDAGTKYIIKSISVTGAQNFNESTVIAFTGLKIGD